MLVDFAAIDDQVTMPVYHYAILFWDALDMLWLLQDNNMIISYHYHMSSFVSDGVLQAHRCVE